MMENGGACECIFEEPEYFLAGGEPFPADILAHKSSERDRHVRVISDKMMIKIGEPKE